MAARGSGWQHPAEQLRPLSAALARRLEPVGDDFDPRPEHFISLRFTGEIEPRNLHGKTEFVGRLFFARAGDLVYSKIDARNGAIGVVPPQFPVAVVTSEFPVYRIRPEVASAEYIQLVFRSDNFRATLDGMVSGASGRKRVQPDELEKLEIPLPTLAEQQAIVADWQRAQAEVGAAESRVAALEIEWVKSFYADLGITPPEAMKRPKCFALDFAALSRWGVSGNVDSLLGLDRLPTSKFAYALLGDHAVVSYGVQKSPANRPGQHPRPYLSVANVRKGYLDLTEVKQINVPDAELEAFRLRVGDILFVEGNGSRSELGRVAMWNGEILDCVHQNHLIKVRAASRSLLPAYTMSWFNTELGRSHFFRAAKTSTGLGTINSNEVRRAPVPLPPLEIQRAIVARIAEARAAIAHERETARRLAEAAKLALEARLLGELNEAPARETGG